MKPSIRLIQYSLLLGMILFLSGCGYHLAGMGSSLPDHARTLAIPVFGNSSGEPGVERALTDELRRTFMNDGRLKLVNKRKAALVMKGNLNYYNLRAVVFSSEDVAEQYWVELGVDIDVFDQVKKKLYLKQSFRTKWAYTATSDVIDTETARREAIEFAYRELANRMVSVLIEQF